MKKVGCIIQARSGSTRLPNKIFLPLPLKSSVTNLEWVIKRVQQAKKVDTIIVATTVDPADDKVEELMNEIDIPVYRGSITNVLSRYYEASVLYDLDVIVRITGDCPCIDPEVLDLIIDTHLKEKNDYTSNTLERTFPHGLDVEVFDFSLIKESFENATQLFEKEHVTSYIYRTHPEKFKIGQVTLTNDYSDIRITLDTYEDYMAISALFHEFSDETFKLNDILKIYREMPWLAFINKNIEQKKQYNSFQEELDETKKWAKRQDLMRMTKWLEGVKVENVDTHRRIE